MPPASSGAACSRHRCRISGRQRSNRDSNRSTVPSTPSSISRRTVRKSPSQRRFWNTVSATPRRRASSTTSRPSADVAASGLSTTTGSPASTASRAIGTCERFGVATTTRSTSPEPMSSSERSNSAVPGWRWSTCARRSGSVVTTAARCRPSVAATSGAWKTRPANPYPSRPTRRDDGPVMRNVYRAGQPQATPMAVVRPRRAVCRTPSGRRGHGRSSGCCRPR